MISDSLLSSWAGCWFRGIWAPHAECVDKGHMISPARTVRSTSVRSASAPRAAKTHEFTLSRSCVHFLRCTDSQIHTLTLVRPTRVPQPLLIHFVTLACPTCAAQIRGVTLSRLRARPVSHGLTHSRPFSRSCVWPVTRARSHAPVSGLSPNKLTHARSHALCACSLPSGLTSSRSHVQPQIHREPAFLVSSSWRASFFHGMYGCTSYSLLLERFKLSVRV